MSTKKKATKRRKMRRDPEVSEAVRERILSLEDAVHAAGDSIATHLGDDDATSIVSSALFTFAASIAWHGTTATEDEFANAARDCYRRIASAHAHCERGEHAEHRHSPEELN